MINTDILNSARQLKKKMDAAYLVFKKSPTAQGASICTSATRAFNDFCVKTIESLIDDSVNKEEEILANIESYRKCEQCGVDLLYMTAEDKYIASSDFVEDFPGWCYSCLVDHCAITECTDCAVSNSSEDCKFYEVKKLINKEGVK